MTSPPRKALVLALVALGVLTLGTGTYFMVLRPRLLPEAGLSIDPPSQTVFDDHLPIRLL